MEDHTAAIVTAGVGVVLLVAMVLVVLRPLRRFTRASAALRGGMAAGTASLQSLLNARRPRDE